MLNDSGFDLWANGYDKSVQLSEESDAYPFAGYKEVLGTIYRRVAEFRHGRQHGTKLLDIGFGTATLTAKLYEAGCDITGIDFSQKMIDIAQPKMPAARLIRSDFTSGLPAELKDERYDFIISTYALHHLTDEQKVRFIRSLEHHLSEEGSLLIGDVAFKTRDELMECRERYVQEWDNDEIYFVFDELESALGQGFRCSYEKISHCAGVITVTR